MNALHLMRANRFAPLFWTQFLGAFNDNFFKNALVILVTFRSARVLGLAPAQMVPLAGGIFILPFFLFSATAGQIADKYEKSKIVRLIKGIEIAIMLLAALGLLTEHYAALLAVLFLMGLHSTFFGPIKYSILPQHLPEPELITGNALIEAGTFLAVLLGTLAGGFLIAIPVWGPSWVSAGLIAAAILGFFTSRRVPAAPAIDHSLQVRWSPITPTWTVFRSVQHNRSLWIAMVAISWFWFFGAAFLSLLPLYCKSTLQASENTVTLFLACFSIGIGLGSLLCGRLSRGKLILGLVPLGAVGMSLFSADLGLHPTREVVGMGRIMADLSLLSMFCGIFIVPLYTMMQERSEPSHRSRTIAANNILNALFMVVSSLGLAALMQNGVTIPQVFLVLSGLNAVASLAIFALLPEFYSSLVNWVGHFKKSV